MNFISGEPSFSCVVSSVPTVSRVVGRGTTTKKVDLDLIKHDSLLSLTVTTETVLLAWDESTSTTTMNQWGSSIISSSRHSPKSKKARLPFSFYGSIVDYNN